MADAYHATIAADGSVEIPGPFRQALGLAAGSAVVIERAGVGLRIRPHEPAAGEDGGEAVG